jgi:hypothetical protein
MVKRDKPPTEDARYPRLKKPGNITDVIYCNNETYIFDRPILLTIITVNKPDTGNHSTANTTGEIGSNSASCENEKGPELVSNMNADQSHESQSEPPNGSIGVDSNQMLVNNDINTSHATDHIDKSCAISQFDEDLSDRRTGKEDTAAALDVRFGMFLCTRKSSSEGYRIALLWRKDTSSVQDGSRQFGKVLYAAQISAFLREQDAVTKESYEYLGPNCCLFKSKLRVCVYQSFIICFLYVNQATTYNCPLLLVPLSD